MTRLLSICLAVWALIDHGQSVSTKLDFQEEKETSDTNSSKEDEDVEVKHTIVVSTKVKNNNRRGLHSSDDGSGALTYAIGRSSNTRKDDGEEVPVIKGYKSVESTIIRTPDSRQKPPDFTDSIYVSRNIRDQYDTYPVAGNPSQWKPSTFFNNINWWTDNSVPSFNVPGRRRDWSDNRNQGTLHRSVTDDGVKEFYCRKCRELSGPNAKGCIQQRSNSWFYESTTPKIKIDGKLVKLN